jgi:uncharacterized coiled-coil DUF342 family protein
MATSTARFEDTDSLTSLEERIHRAVELVGQLRKEKDSLQALLDEANTERDAAVMAASQLKEQTASLHEELDGLKAERKQVRSRIEKLLGQMDVLSAS